MSYNSVRLPHLPLRKANHLAAGNAFYILFFLLCQHLFIKKIYLFFIFIITHWFYINIDVEKNYPQPRIPVYFRASNLGGWRPSELRKFKKIIKNQNIKYLLNIFLQDSQ